MSKAKSTSGIDVYLGEDGLKESFQGPHSASTPCAYCKGTARIAMVVAENSKSNGQPRHVCDLHRNDPDNEGYWVHDACTIALYICKKCLKITAEMNQA